jgi:hypothetical protein
MARMFDLIKRGKVRTVGNRLKRLQSAVPVVADNVAAYLWAGKTTLDDERVYVNGQLEWSDYPNLKPPFDNYLVEWLTVTPDMKKGSKWHGVHITKAEDGTSESCGNVRLRCELFITDAERNDSIVVGPAIAYEIQVAKDGTFVDARIAEQFFFGADDAETEDIQLAYLTMMQPAFLATSFMHCRNIIVNEVAPPRKLAKASRKRHGVPLVSYRTINIEPMRKLLRSEGRSNETGIKHALHICRGHFRTYTPDKPLFGKVTGTVFVPMHARGSAQEGIVVQNYTVIAPSPRSLSGSPA